MQDADRENSARLTSWKEIATHVGKAVRTVQRWEVELGLPVHRLPGKKRDIVFAYVAEIDDWLRRSAPLLQHDTEAAAQAVEEQTPENGNGASHAIPAERPSSVGDSLARPGREGENLVASGSATIEPPLSVRPPGGHARWWVAAAVAVLLAAGAYVTLALHDARQPVRIEFKGRDLVAFDNRDRELWSYQADFPLADQVRQTAERPPGTPILDFYAIVDLDGDGDKEVLVIFAAKDPVPEYSRVLHCFSARGDLLWRYALTEDKIYGNTPYRGFLVDSFRVFDAGDGRHKHVWVNSRHARWFPTAVTKLDAGGRNLGIYWHHGHLNLLEAGTFAGRRAMYVGATNNEFMSATISVLDYDNPSGTAPALKEGYRCHDCPPLSPLAYTVLTRSHLSQVLDSRPVVTELRLLPDGQIEVMTASAEVSGAKAGECFHFDSNLRLLEAEVVESYVEVHRELRLKGMIREPLDRKKEAAYLAAGVRRWNGTAFVPVDGASLAAKAALHSTPAPVARSPMLHAKGAATPLARR